MQDILFPSYFQLTFDQNEGSFGLPGEILSQLLKYRGVEILRRVSSDQQKGLDEIYGKRYQETRIQKRREVLNPEALLYFVLARSFFTNCYGERGYGLMLENSSLQKCLSKLGLSKMPARSTLHEHLNFLSEETLDFINSSILSTVKNEGLDNFLWLTMDSTAIASVSTFPVDNNMLVRLLEKFYSSTTSLIDLRLEEKGWRSIINSLPLKSASNLMKDIINISKQISFAKGKKNARQIRTEGYHKLCAKGEKLLAKLSDIADRLDLSGLSKELQNNYFELYKTVDEKLYFVQKRFKIAMPGDMGEIEPELLLSLSDEDAAFIKKGGRETIFGYRPNFARSQQGFITSVTLEAGNTSDTSVFISTIKDHQNQSGVLPAIVSTDDGYCSNDNLNKAIDMGIELVSFSGSKGKNLFGDEFWQEQPNRIIRDMRSNAEATISHFKNDYDMSRLSVGGISKVRKEILMRTITFNLELLAKKLSKRCQSENKKIAA